MHQQEDISRTLALCLFHCLSLKIGTDSLTVSICLCVCFIQGHSLIMCANSNHTHTHITKQFIFDQTLSVIFFKRFIEEKPLRRAVTSSPSTVRGPPTLVIQGWSSTWVSIQRHGEKGTLQ